MKKEIIIIKDSSELSKYLSGFNKIEFIGLPGSGKTTVTRELHNSQRGVMIEANDEWHSTWKRKAVSFILKHPALMVWWSFTALFESISIGKPKLFLDKLNKMLVSGARWEYLHSTHPKEVKLLDEGFMQGILSLYEHPISKQQTLRALKKFPIGDCVIFFDGDFAYDETDKVPGRRLKFGPDYVRQWKHTFASNLAVLVSVLDEQDLSSLILVK